MFVIYLNFNLIEIRVDLYKLIKFSRRNYCVQATGIEEWKNIIKIVSFYGMISNIGLLIFTINAFEGINP